MGFLYLGQVTDTGASAFLPYGDGVIEGGGSTAITLPTSASATSQFLRGFSVLILSSSGAGQVRRITDYTTGRVATVYPPFDGPIPSTASTCVIGVPTIDRNVLHVRAEHAGTATTGTFRAAVYDNSTAGGATISTTFQLAFIDTTAGVRQSNYQGETKVVQVIPADASLAKVYVDVAPTANVELFLMAGVEQRRA